MDDLKLKANEAQEKLAALQKQRGLIGVDETDNIVTDKLKDLDEQLTAAESDRIVKEARYRIAGSGNPELDRLNCARSHAASFALAAGTIARGLCPAEHEIRRGISQAGGAGQPDVRRSTARSMPS